MDPAEYCREVEAYLCRKNDGHLIRIVGPAFEQVCSWAARGVPLKVVFGGIDRRFERYYAKGPRRRPVRIEFCEADILDLFDDWRRAVGVRATAGEETGDVGEPSRGVRGAEAGRSKPRPPGLRLHFDRTIARLTALRAGPEALPGVHAAVDRIVHGLDVERSGAKAPRGTARVHVLEHLNTLDEELLAAARRGADAALLEALRREAETELAPFRTRMPPRHFQRALESCTNRLLRERLGLPRISLE